MFEDVFNRKFCGNGVPDWAAVHDEVNATNMWKCAYLLMAPHACSWVEQRAH